MKRILIIIAILSPLTVTALPSGPYTYIVWDQNTDNPDGYYVYYRTTSEAYSDTRRIKVVGATTTSQIISAIPNAPDRYYAITAYNAKGESQFSTEIGPFVQTGGVIPDPLLPAAPSNLQLR